MGSLKERVKVLKRVQVQVGEDFIIEVQHNGVKIIEALVHVSQAEVSFSRNAKPKLELKYTVLKNE